MNSQLSLSFQCLILGNRAYDTSVTCAAYMAVSSLSRVNQPQLGLWFLHPYPVPREEALVSQLQTYLHISETVHGLVTVALA
jgi:hypothetical protein